MGFYESIVEHYDAIFPTRPNKIAFVDQLAASNGAQSLLDIGCATGSFAAAMAERLGRVEAFDLDASMINIAKSRHGDANPSFQVGNMLKVDELYPGQTFDIITCFGNTLVHIKPHEVQDVLEKVRSMLSNIGIFVLQILNYDHILNNDITELPLIDNPMVRFARHYTLGKDSILFHTQLLVKVTQETHKSTIALYPILLSELLAGLDAAGFGQVTCYQSYKGDKEDGKHLPRIVVAKP